MNNFLAGLMELIACFPVLLIIDRKWCDRSKLITSSFMILAILMFGASICEYLSKGEHTSPWIRLKVKGLWVLNFKNMQAIKS